MPRMIAVGDLDLDEKLGAALDPLGAADIPPACDPVARWLTLDRLIAEERAAEGMEPLPGRARLNLAREMARTMDRLLVETDAPYLAPKRWRGKRNEPSYVVNTAEVLAEVKGVSYAEMAEITTDNAFRCFSKMPRLA